MGTARILAFFRRDTPVSFAVQAALVLAACGALLLPGLGDASFRRAEIYFVDGALSMMERGDYLVPHFRGEPFFDKPPLATWMIVACFQVLGVGRGVARLPSVVAALGTLLTTFWLGSRLLGRRAALCGALVLATTVAFMLFGRMAMSDMVLTLGTTLAVTLAIEVYRRPAVTFALPALGLVLGLAFLTKGPIALVLAGSGVLLAAWSGHKRLGKRPVGLAAASLAAALFVVAGLAWFGLVYGHLGPEPLRIFFVRENLQRFSGQSYGPIRPFWFYVGAYLSAGLPWSLFLPLAARGAWATSDASDGAEERAGARMLLGWAGLMFLALSASRFKIDYYLLPVLPPLALVIGRYLGVPTWSRLDALWGRVVLVAAGSLALVAALVPPPIPDAWLPSPLARLTTALLLGAMGLACLGTARRPTPGRVLGALGGLAGALFLCAVVFYLPAFAAGQPNRALIEDIRREQRSRPDLSVVMCKDVVNLQRDLQWETRAAAEERCDLDAVARGPGPVLMVLRPEDRVAGLRLVSERAYLPYNVVKLSRLLEGPAPARLRLVANYEPR